jgi:hypothetical protein
MRLLYIALFLALISGGLCATCSKDSDCGTYCCIDSKCDVCSLRDALSELIAAYVFFVLGGIIFWVDIVLCCCMCCRSGSTTVIVAGGQQPVMVNRQGY